MPLTNIRSDDELTDEELERRRQISDPTATEMLTLIQMDNIANVKKKFGGFSPETLRDFAEHDMLFRDVTINRCLWLHRVAYKLEKAGYPNLNAVPDTEFYPIAHSIV